MEEFTITKYKSKNGSIYDCREDAIKADELYDLRIDIDGEIKNLKSLKQYSKFANKVKDTTYVALKIYGKYDNPFTEYGLGVPGLNMAIWNIFRYQNNFVYQYGDTQLVELVDRVYKINDPELAYNLLWKRSGNQYEDFEADTIIVCKE